MAAQALRAYASADLPSSRLDPGQVVVGESRVWRDVMSRVDQVASTPASVLLLGETGTGKEMVARAIHARSPRSHHALVTVNCSALPATLFEAELFGHERGAFTGAETGRPGRFEIAHRGTLFLDEVSDLQLELQPKLLRALQEKTVERLGSAHLIPTDVRIIAATGENLSEEVRERRFRSDLYYRLNVFPITLPPLRDRREDIPLLARHLLERYSATLRKPVDQIASSAMRALESYNWPGNVRELENVIQRAIITCSDGVITLRDVTGFQAEIGGMGSDLSLNGVMRRHIERVLSAAHWRIEGSDGAARALGLKSSTLRGRLRRLGLNRHP
jgi:formate hydrogenlyase transcriptional activator